MTPPDLASSLRWLLSTLAGGFVLVLAVLCAGILVGVFITGVCWVAPVGVCL
jgi:hypothetical protein